MSPRVPEKLRFTAVLGIWANRGKMVSDAQHRGPDRGGRLGNVAEWRGGFLGMFQIGCLAAFFAIVVGRAVSLRIRSRVNPNCTWRRVLCPCGERATGRASRKTESVKEA